MQINDETFITQKTFRALLQAMSHPGRVYQLEQKTEVRSQITDKYNLFSVLQTLLDHEVGFCVIGKEKEYLKSNISELTGCPVKDISDADFIIVSDGESNGEILKAKKGSLEYPDTGATVIYSIRSLSQIPPYPPLVKGGIRGDLKLTLKGPGINGEISLFLVGVSKKEFHYLKEINSEYPLGIDSVFIDSANRIMCIPRSTRIEVR